VNRLRAVQPIKAGPPAWELGEGLTTPHCKNLACYKMLHRASEWNNLHNGKWI
jgi:hypothetical protein